ncbi:MAG: FliA/WhiG family RNA polymerase sigma factor, partial [Deltaproteobacteria bacterium]|nr:FliA/WhiG family RNA polymerase sigma factor [Deltaproteobacteria bacterium]
MSETQAYGPGGVDKPSWRGLSMAEKTQYVEQYSPLIRYLADRLASRLPGHIVKDDLISAGVLGLIDAIDRFEADRGIMFKTYAEFRIKGSMIDELRSLDWVPRTVRKKANELEKLLRKLEQELGHPPSDEETAAAMGITVPAFLKLLDEVSAVNMVDLDGFRSEGSTGREPADVYGILADENGVDALAAIGQRESRQILVEAIDSLPEKEKLVVTLYYHEELTMKEIGQVMGYTESRISQLHTKSMLKLRGRLADYFDKKKRAKDPTDPSDPKDPKGLKEPKEPKAAKAPKPTKEPKAPKPTQPPAQPGASPPAGPPSQPGAPKAP